MLEQKICSNLKSFSDIFLLPILRIICLYWRHFGGGDDGYLDLAVGAGAGVRVGQAEVGPPP